MNTEIIYGIHPVTEAFKAKRRRIFEIYITKENISNRIDNILETAEKNNIVIKKITTESLKSIAQTIQHQNIAIKASNYPIVDILEIIHNPKPVLLILDSIVDPHNLGAIIRTALCFGVNGVVIPKDRAVSPTPSVSKASSGALEHILLSQVTNLTNTIKILKERGIWAIGLDKSSKEIISNLDLDIPLSIVIGGEERGIRPLVKKQCDYLVSIPQAGYIDSLNASVAGAIAMYEVFTKKKKG